MAYLLLFFFFPSNSDISLCVTMALSAVTVGSGVPRSAVLLSLQKVNRRLHLSKSKNTKFNESGQLCVFHLVSSVWSFYILITVREALMWLCIWGMAAFSDIQSGLFSFFPPLLQEGYLLHPSSLWENYPHSHLRYKHMNRLSTIVFMVTDERAEESSSVAEFNVVSHTLNTIERIFFFWMFFGIWNFFAISTISVSGHLSYDFWYFINFMFEMFRLSAFFSLKMNGAVFNNLKTVQIVKIFAVFFIVFLFF